MIPIRKHFEAITISLTEVQNLIDIFDCNESTDFIYRQVIKNIQKDIKSTQKGLKTIAIEQEKRFSNLESAYKLVDDAQTKASNSVGWCVQSEDNITIVKGKISVFTITLSESGYELSNGEIISTESKKILTRTLLFRKFQPLVPEVSIGSAFTFFKYNTYATTTDSAGTGKTTRFLHVASPTENIIRNLNISTMISWNLYTPNSAVHPLIQTGVGLNAGIPSLLVGGGLRFSNNSKNRIRITTGIAFSWIQELDKLKVGDVVKGADDIEKDLKYQLTLWGSKNKPKPYLSIQYNF